MRILTVLLYIIFCASLSVLGQNRNAETIVIGKLDSISTSEVLLSGTVTTSNNQTVLPGVTVFVPQINKGTVTNNEGEYELTLMPGDYEIHFRFLGMESVVKNILVYSSGELHIQMEEKLLDLDEVIVEAKQEDNNVLGVVTGVESVSITDLQQLPSLLGEVDVINSLVMLPGVNTVGEGSSGFNVRGGRADQNLILMNGAPLFNSSHVLGLFSVYNPDVTESYSLYKGHIPARFGGRLSSVLDVNMRNGSMEQFRLEGGAGIASARLLVEGPIAKDKTSFLIAGRNSYSDWLLKSVKNLDIRNSDASFYDLNLNITHHLSGTDRLDLYLYGSHDRFKYADQFGYSWNNRIANFRWTHQFDTNMVMELLAVAGRYNSSYFDPFGVDAFKLKSGINYYKTKANIYYQPNAIHTFNGGIEWNSYDNSPEYLHPYNESSTVSANTVSKDQGRSFAVYFGDDISVTPHIQLSLGVRYSLFQNLGPGEVFIYNEHEPRAVRTITDTLSYGNGKIISSYGGIEPRVSSRFLINESGSIKLSYNRTRQYIHLISNSTSPTPADIWQVSSPYIPEQRANSYSIGYFRNFKDNRWETSVELFYRDIDNLVEYVDFAELFQNPHLETELIAAKGRAWGGELSIRKSTGKWTGWLSYSMTKSMVRSISDVPEKQINGNEWYPSNYDQPHTVNLVAKRRLGKRSAFSFSFTYRTGRPITALESSYSDNNSTIPVFSDRNKYRIPDYIRLDVSFTIAENIWKNRTVDPNRRYKDSMTISFYNLLSRDNAFSVFYKRSPESEIPQAYKLSVLGAIIPSVTYNFRF